MIYITSAAKELTPGQKLNLVGNYLFKNIDSSYNRKKSSNMYDIYFTLLYQIPQDIIDKYKLDDKYSEVQEMDMNINITTYKQKLRINLLEMDPDELTLGCKVIDLKDNNDLDGLRNTILDYLDKKLQKEYEDYEFIY